MSVKLVAAEQVIDSAEDAQPKAQVGGVRLGDHWQLWMGLFIVAVVILAPRGVLGLASSLLARLRGEGRAK